MTRRDALNELLTKVEAGDRGAGLNTISVFPEPKQAMYCADAFYGSLDAAKALHEAVLPGWVAKPEIGGQGNGRKLWHCVLEDWNSGDEATGGPCEIPARAWLIAILKVLIAEANGRERDQ